MTGNATMTRRATGCLKKVAPEKKVFGHFLLLDGSIWTDTMLYDQGPKKGHMAARQAVFWPLGRILAFFRDSYLKRESTPNFGARSTKLGWIVRFTKKMTCSGNEAG